MKRFIWILAIAVLFAGCTSTNYNTSYSTTISPDQDDQLGGTGIESTDIGTVGRQMAESIIEIPEIVNAQGMPRIALLPVKNSTRFVINKDIFTKKIRSELNKNARGKVRFLARDRMDDILAEREAKDSGLVSSSKRASVKGADYFLTGELSGLAKAQGGHRSDYILMAFQLIDAETSEIVWEDIYEVKRVGTAGVIYQ